MKSNPRMGILISGLILVFVVSVNLVTIIMEKEESWWTHVDMKESLNESEERTEVYVKDILLRDHLSKGKLILEDELGSNILTEEDVSFRFNNVDRVKASKIPIVAYCSAASAIGFLMMIYGLVPFFVKVKQ